MILQRILNRGIRLGTVFERAARRYPANVVILDHDLDLAPGRRFTVAELADVVDDTASRLWAAGVRPGEHVVVYKSDGFDITLLAFAAARIGAVPVLLSAKLDGHTVSVMLPRAQRPHLVTDQSKLDDELPGSVFDITSSVLLTSGEHAKAKRLADFAGTERVRPVIMPPDHPTLVTHTSGTTGIPKMAVHTGASLQSRYRPQAVAMAFKRTREPIAMHVSFVHSRIISATAISLYRGFPLVVLVDDAPDHVAGIFAAVRPGILEAHPNSFMRWEELADDPREPLATVQLFSSTFDAIHPRTIHRLTRASRRRVPLFGQLYGQSETGPVVVRTYTRFRSAEADGRCVGWGFPGMTGIRVVSRDGKRPTRTSPGLVEARSDGRAITFLGEPDRYTEQTRGTWWRMGDLGYRTRWGCLHMLDREIDEIPGFGSTLAAEDQLLARLDALVEVVIIPGPDGRAVPVVSTRDDQPLDPAAWTAATAGLPTMSPPVHKRLSDLPHTATTKVKRLELASNLRTNDAD
ncbi:AMP-binding protein [Actinokineospora enzanensis]|uniref:AMP-binding protein n=1 Tax=Actinokineospora enzanensis TaxID=155975 RepID=UPI00036873D7|nr:AMP-binding protein [Actinokineospora enzanensis]